MKPFKLYEARVCPFLNVCGSYYTDLYLGFETRVCLCLGMVWTVAGGQSKSQSCFDLC